MDLSKLLDLNSAWFPFLLLFVSIFGSTHCLVMCVPILASQDTSQKNDSKRVGNKNHGSWSGFNRVSSYHFGRLFSYLAVASLFYYVGQKILYNQILWLIVGFVFLGYFVWISVREYSTKCCVKSKRRFSNLFLLGLTNGFLPCGWLFLILLMLSKVQSYTFFLLCVAIFWLGTVPIFYILNLKKTVKKYLPILTNRPLVTSIYFTFALYSFFLHYKNMPNEHLLQSGSFWRVLCGI